MAKINPSRNQNKTTNFMYFFDKIAWGAITAVAVYSSQQITKMSDSIVDLSRNVAVVIVKMEAYDKKSEKLEDKLIVLEERINACEKVVSK